MTADESEKNMDFTLMSTADGIEWLLNNIPKDNPGCVDCDIYEKCCEEENRDYCEKDIYDEEDEELRMFFRKHIRGNDDRNN